VNDQFGHECGDVVLKELSKAFSDFMTGLGQVSRWGGEEFLFVFENHGKDETCYQLERLNERLKKLILIYEEHPLHVALTYGVAEYQGGDYHSTIIQADQKLFVGKRSGRNQIVL
jgi:diguanylate cyclase (GGDEF)-like protein